MSHPPLRVAMIIQAYPLISGGAERLLQATVPGLRDLGVEVHIITRRFPDQPAFELLDQIPVYRLPRIGPTPVTSVLFTLNTQRLIARLRPDVLHSHELFSPTTTAILGRALFHIPVVATIHGGGDLGDIPELRRRFMGDTRLKIFCSHVDRFIIISREIEHEAKKAGIPPDRRVFIPNGVDTRRFFPVDPMTRRQLRERLHLPLSAPVVVFTGRLVPLKRVTHLISVWQAVREVHPGAQLLILGSGPEEASLRQMAGAGVNLPGGVEDVLPYLQAADLFVLPSIAEGLSIAVLEAMACGLPVLTTQVGGNLELITHAETGWLIPPDNPQALQNALLSLLNDEVLRHQLGAQAAAHVRQNYDISANVNQLFQVYRSLKPGGGV